MRHAAALKERQAANPLDMVEEIVVANDWAFDRRGDDEIAIDVPGAWGTYTLFFAWSERLGALHFSATIDLRIAARRRQAVCELLAEVNERMWLGHFALWGEESLPMFRHSVLTRDGGPGHDHIEDLVRVAITECDRFYPAFQYVVWGGKAAGEAMAAAMLDTVGEA